MGGIFRLRPVFAGDQFSRAAGETWVFLLGGQKRVTAPFVRMGASTSDFKDCGLRPGDGCGIGLV